MANTPDVKNGLHPAVLIGGVMAIILIVFVVAIVIYKSNRDSQPTQSEGDIFQSETLPSDFFYVAPAPEPEPEP
jgi:hypothetical protein